MRWVLVRIALRNLRLHWVRTLIVGVLLLVGTWLLVVGQAALEAIQVGMRHSVVDTVAGDLQVYSAHAKDKLELYQSAALAAPDIGQIDDWSALHEVLEGLPEVESAIPMGKSLSVVTGGSMLDTKLAELRKAISDGDTARRAPLVAHVRQLVTSLRGELDKLAEVAADDDEIAQQRADLAKAESDGFWAGFDADPLDALEFLENKIAPLGLQSGIYFLGFLGTDLDAFAKNFKKFEIISGQMVPPGERGFMFNTTTYERLIKHRTARRLDVIKDARDLEHRRIATDEDLARKVTRNATQVASITDQLDPERTREVTALLRTEMGLPDAELPELLGEFMRMTDGNFDQRYAWFYANIAPRIRLYAFEPGDTLTLYGQTKSGYPRAVNVKVWGVYGFKGLERSALAGAFHLMDLVTFRELYGLSDPVTAAEVKKITERAGIEEVAREGAEDALFGGDAEVVQHVESAAFDEVAGHDLAGLRRAAEAKRQAGFTQDELDHGPVLNVAVFLKDASEAALPVAAERIRAAAHDHGVDVQVVPWDVARGDTVSGVSLGISLLFYVSVTLVFLVALIIIVNALLMSTTDRISEIGTIRAVGGQRGFVMRMFAVEAGTMGLLFGLAGLALGALTVASASASGIPATSELQFFIYGGTALHPDLVPRHLLIALAVIVVVTVVSSLLPAWVASRISPVTAMQTKE
ncbi:MAG: FtsX-like permease family protein [Deltaproteobacteria bacterium]|nr:MAG: FtsX-like permease family protein [Deltaproteobacteria bacterium]